MKAVRKRGTAVEFGDAILVDKVGL